MTMIDNFLTLRDRKIYVKHIDWITKQNLQVSKKAPLKEKRKKGLKMSTLRPEKTTNVTFGPFQHRKKILSFHPKNMRGGLQPPLYNESKL